MKTTYYLRSLGATQIEKSTTDVNRRGLQPRWMKNQSASSNIKVERETQVVEVATTITEVKVAGTTAIPKAVCNLDGDCESCQ